jgi:hypothetical protein
MRESYFPSSLRRRNRGLGRSRCRLCPASVSLNHGQGATPPNRLTPWERRVLRAKAAALLEGVGEDPGKWGAPNEAGLKAGTLVVQYKRRLTDIEIDRLPGGLSTPAVDEE